MPTVNRPAASQGSSKATATAKYSNKDGTKYISVPKSSASTPPTQPSPTTTSSSSKGAEPVAQASASENVPAPAVNRKKQKRRAKAAAKAAAEQAEAAANDPASTTGVSNGLSQKGNPGSSSATQPGSAEGANTQQSGEQWGEETESEDGSRLDDGHPNQESQANGTSTKSKKSRKKKKNKNAEQRREPSPAPRSSGISKEKIWNTSGPEERERIKQFWLGLGEDERKSLVKVEKDAVLKKMKEQQKHTCSCSVCGRKRTAIEEELEGLYDAYYEELESFANQPHNHPNGPSMFGGPKRFGPLTGLHPPGALPSRYSNHHPSRGRIVEHVDNDEDEDEEDDEDDVYSEEEDDDLDEEDDEDEPEEIPRNSYQNEFFTFGQSLTVKGGILTVADDLLKNDGKKFIEMMEQLAERRMAREEDAKDHYGGYGHMNGGNLPPPHNHPPPDEEEYDEDEEEPDDDYASQDYDDEDEEEDTMTEEQRMEEGRRMFQIFAARMFEQRVLTAYREKVAKERQEKLLEELAAEDLRESQKAAKKAKDAQKRKDKAAQKKQAQLEEKARKEAAKAAEEAARRAEEAERIEEAKRKAEDKRKKKEAQKKAEEEDRLRKEAERQRRAIEQKERQAEQERKAREAKEREKQAKEERQRKEQEAREQKERETRERREKHERDKREKEQRAAQAKAERDAKEKQKQEDKASLKNSGPAAPASAPTSKKQLPVSVPAIPHHPATAIASPQIPVATPVLPKAPTPMKPRAASLEVSRSASQASQTGSGQSISTSPQPPTPVSSTPGPNGPSGKTPPSGPGLGGQHPQQRTMTPLGMKSPPGLPQSPYNMGMPPANMQFPPGIPPMGPGFGQAIFPPMPGAFRPGGLPPPGLGGQMGGRQFPMPQAPPGFHQVDPLSGMHPAFGPVDGLAQAQPSAHSRQGSLTFDSGAHDANVGTPVHPIARPAPIGRPMANQGSNHAELNADVEDMSNHLGSSALLDDDFDEPFNKPGSMRRGTTAPGARQPFVSGPFMDSVFGTSPMSGGWAAPINNAFPPPPGFGNAAWPPSGPAFGGPPPGMRPAQPRSITIRQILVQSCKDLQNHAADAQGWIDLSAVKGHVDSIAPEPVTEAELLDMCETEGNAQNGGGTFDVKHADNQKVSIKYDPDMAPAPSPFARNVGAPGEIGSPIVRHSATFGSRF